MSRFADESRRVYGIHSKQCNRDQFPGNEPPDDRVVIYTARGDPPEGSDPSEHPHVLVAVAVCESGQTIDEITDALRNWGDEPELQ